MTIFKRGDSTPVTIGNIEDIFNAIISGAAAAPFGGAANLFGDISGQGGFNMSSTTVFGTNIDIISMTTAGGVFGGAIRIFPSRVNGTVLQNGDQTYTIQFFGNNVTESIRHIASVVDASGGGSSSGQWDTFIVRAAGGALTNVFRLDPSATANDTAMLIFDVNSLTLKRVSVGIADSGGAGFRLLRIPN